MKLKVISIIAFKIMREKYSVKRIGFKISLKLFYYKYMLLVNGFNYFL